MSDMNRLQAMIDASRHLVFFGGAGTSTESGIKDFRSAGGLYSTDFHGYPPEEVLSIGFLKAHYELFMEYVREQLSVEGVRPNAGHEKLAALEEAGILKAIITQNIDGLHQQAGSKNVIEIHGTLHRWYCTGCRQHAAKPFTCNCRPDAMVRPDVTLYGEALNEKAVDAAIHAICSADTLIVCGTSLTVYPAAAYLRYFRGDNLIIINRDATDYDGRASLKMTDSFAEVFSRIQVREG